MVTLILMTLLWAYAFLEIWLATYYLLSSCHRKGDIHELISSRSLPANLSFSLASPMSHSTSLHLPGLTLWISSSVWQLSVSSSLLYSLLGQFHPPYSFKMFIDIIKIPSYVSSKLKTVYPAVYLKSRLPCFMDLSNVGSQHPLSSLFALFRLPSIGEHLFLSVTSCCISWSAAFSSFLHALSFLTSAYKFALQRSLSWLSHIKMISPFSLLWVYSSILLLVLIRTFQTQKCSICFFSHLLIR